MLGLLRGFCPLWSAMSIEADFLVKSLGNAERARCASPLPAAPPVPALPVYSHAFGAPACPLALIVPALKSTMLSAQCMEAVVALAPPIPVVFPPLAAMSLPASVFLLATTLSPIAALLPIAAVMLGAVVPLVAAATLIMPPVLVLQGQGKLPSCNLISDIRAY